MRNITKFIVQNNWIRVGSSLWLWQDKILPVWTRKSRFLTKNATGTPILTPGTGFWPPDPDFDPRDPDFDPKNPIFDPPGAVFWPRMACGNTSEAKNRDFLQNLQIPKIGVHPVFCGFVILHKYRSKKRQKKKAKIFVSG